jgi:hypothetical protein
MSSHSMSKNGNTDARTAMLQEKADDVQRVLDEPIVDLWLLRELALTEGGLVNDELRQRAWPKLVGLHELWDGSDETLPTPKSDDTTFALSSQASAQNSKESALSSNATEDSSSPRSSMFPLSTSEPLHRTAGSLGSNKTKERVPKIVARSLDMEQISLDVTRCTWHLLTGTQRSQAFQMEHKRHRKVARQIKRKQRRLANLINLALQKSYALRERDINSKSRLRYYQGYHDVACIFLSALGGSSGMQTSKFASAVSGTAASVGLDLPAAVLLQVSRSHLRDPMKSSFRQLQTCLCLTFFPLLALFDRTLHDHLVAGEMTEPTFALSWIITWFAHDVRDTELVKRLFDAFLVSHPLLPLYVTLAMLMHQHNREEILSTECEFSSLHQVLAGLPKNSSAVGWKYRPGDGYVSDDDYYGSDDHSVTTCTTVDTVDGDVLVEDLKMVDLGYFGLNATSVSSGPSALVEVSTSSQVSFQTLIDTAVRYMDRVPPSDLVSLAKRYYGAETVNDWLTSDSTPESGISLLSDTPSWSIERYAKADWLLKQNSRARRGVRARNRRDRRKDQQRGVLLTTTPGRRTVDVDPTTATPGQFLQQNADRVAVIAAGYGLGDMARRARRRTRVRWVRGATVLVLWAVLYAGLTRYRRKAPVVTLTDCDVHGSVAEL